MRAAFAGALRVVWRVLLAFCGAGLLSVALQRQIALHAKMDDRYGMKERKKGGAAALEDGSGAGSGSPSECEKEEAKGDGEVVLTADVLHGRADGSVRAPAQLSPSAA